MTLPNPPYKFSAIVLCGGGSERMGFDKFRLPLGERTFLECVLEQLLISFEGPIFSIAAESTLSEVRKINQKFDSDRLHVFSDEQNDSGPLEGIRVGLKSAEALSRWAFVTSCDAPLLSGDVVRMLQGLVDLAAKETEAIIPASATRIYGMTAFYRTDTHPKIASLIDQEKLRVSGLASELDSQMIDIEELRAVDPQLDSIRNLNLPSHYLEFLREKGFVCPPEIKEQLKLMPKS